MNRTKTILAAVGGVALVAVAAAGYFAWLQQASRTAALEGDDDGAVGLDTVTEKVQRLMGKKVFPGAESVKLLTESREDVAAWRDEALSFAARGDRRLAPTTDAAFKEFIVGDARRLRAMPDGRGRKTLDAAFDFGEFKPYIAEGKMPEQASLKALQRKWDDVSTIIETLSACGVESLTSIREKAPEQPKEETPAPKRGQKRRPAAKAADASRSDSGVQPVAHTYVVACKTHPDSFVKALDELATCERFTVVSDVSIRREKDRVAEGLGAGEKKEESASSGRRRRRPSAAEAAARTEKKDEEPALFKLVADPVSEPPLEVRLTVTVYDFGSAEGKKTEGEDGK